MAEKITGQAIATHPATLTEDLSTIETAIPSHSIVVPTAATTATTPRTTERIPTNPNDIGESVADRARREKAEVVRNKFSDILQVKPTNCDSIEFDLDNYSDDVNVAASLSKPSSIEFFREIGASEFILKSLTDGHRSTLTEDVQPFERRNNRSYFENEEFAVKEIFELVKKG